MPEIGEIRNAKEIGKTGGKYIWLACNDCRKERWTAYRNGEAKATRCHACNNKHLFSKLRESRKKHCKHTRGYIYVRLYPEDFFYPMADKSHYVLEHRLVVAKALNRCLLAWEVVHHRGAKYPLGSIENKQDNRYPENLELLKSSGRHNTRIDQELKRQAGEISILQQRVTLLEAENVLLRGRCKVNQGISLG